MATLTYNSKVAITDDQGSTDVVSTQKSFTFTAKEDKQFSIAANATEVIYNPTIDSSEATTDFDFMYLLSDGDLDVELTINEGDANEELISFRLAADVPFTLGADDAYSNHSASNAFGGTLDVIDKIRVDEPNAAAVTLRFIMVT